MPRAMWRGHLLRPVDDPRERLPGYGGEDPALPNQLHDEDGAGYG